MECRLGLASDQPAVIEAFPGLYDGWDIVTNLYNAWLDDPKFVLFVGDLQGKIVSTTVH